MEYLESSHQIDNNLILIWDSYFASAYNFFYFNMYISKLND